MNHVLTAITVHKIPGKAICGVVVLEQQAEGSWTGVCSRCTKSFRHDKDPTFEQQVLAVRH